MRILPCTLLAIFVAGCTAGGIGGTSPGTQGAIVGGSRDSGDPGVVMLYGQLHSDATKFTVCSASVIAPSFLLTAAHCVANTDYDYYVGTRSSYNPFDSDFSTSNLTAIASATVDPAYDPSTSPHPHDLAVVALSNTMGTVLPFGAGSVDDSWLNQSMRLVGYGMTGSTAADQGTKHDVSTSLASYTGEDLEITNGKQPCGGDSGGPAFMTFGGVETIVGVAAAAATNCTSAGYYTRVDTNMDFINGQIGVTTSPQNTPDGGTDSGS